VSVNPNPIDDYVNMRFAAGFTLPCEGAVPEANVHAATKQFAPENSNLFALGNAVVETKAAETLVPETYSDALKYQPVT